MCIHFEQGNGVSKIVGKSFTLPLNRNLVTYRGQVTLAPIREFHIQFGTAMARVKDGALELLFHSSQHFLFQSEIELNLKRRAAYWAVRRTIGCR